MNMIRPRFPEPFKHAHPPVQNINEILEAQRTFGQKTEEEVRSILDHLAAQNDALIEIHRLLDEMQKPTR